MCYNRMAALTYLLFLRSNGRHAQDGAVLARTAQQTVTDRIWMGDSLQNVGATEFCKYCVIDSTNIGLQIFLIAIGASVVELFLRSETVIDTCHSITRPQTCDAVQNSRYHIRCTTTCTNIKSTCSPSCASNHRTRTSKCWTIPRVRADTLLTLLLHEN